MTEQVDAELLDLWVTGRQRARTDLFWLCTEVLGYDWVNHKVHDQMIEFLPKKLGGTDNFDETRKKFFGYQPAVPIEEFDIDGFRNYLLLFPRGTLKTTVATVCDTIQWIINWPAIRIAIVTAVGEQAETAYDEIRKKFQFCNRFRQLFPELCPPAKTAADWGNSEKFTVCNRPKLRKEPTVSLISVGKVIAGYHYDLLKISDIVDINNSGTPGQIGNVIRFVGFCEPLIETFLNQKSGWKMVEGTTYDFADFHQTIRDNEEAKKPEDRNWKILVRSAINEDGTALWEEKLPVVKLKAMETDPTIGPYIVACLPGSAPILMSDWSEKPIDQIEIGDTIIGFQRGKFRMKLVPAKVTATHCHHDNIFKITMKSRRVVYCTHDHKWFTGRNPHKETNERWPHKSYLPPRIGGEMVCVYDLRRYLHNSATQRLWDWLGGMMDGEGSCFERNLPTISQSEHANPEVCAAIESTCKTLNIEIYHHRKKPDCHINRLPSSLYVLKGGRNIKLALLRYCTMAKRDRVEKSLWMASYKLGFEKKELSDEVGADDRIVTIEFVGAGNVYGITTETGNYIAYGFASANSQYYLNPVPTSGALATRDQVLFLPHRIIEQIRTRLNIYCTIDLAGMDDDASNKAKNDDSVLNVGGWDRDGRLYEMDIRAGKWTPHQIIEHMFEINRIYRPIAFKIEKEGHSRVLAPFFRREMEKRGIFLNLIMMQRDNRRSKKQRISGLQSYFTAGKTIYFDETITCRAELINQIVRFSTTSTYKDDILDTIVDQCFTEDGKPAIDALPNAPKEPDTRPGPVRDKFMGFDPLSFQPMWSWNPSGTGIDTRFYDAITGAL